MEIADLVEKASKSVVGIVAGEVGDFGEVLQRGFGTGFYIDRGVVATAYHVVAGADVVTLVTPEGDAAEANVAAGDPQDDIAILYTEVAGSPLSMGSALKLRVGEYVVALGYPLAMLDKPTATLGIVSAVGRSLRAGDRIFEGLIQTDAAINPGNSGGPLVTLGGEAVGVNSAIIAGAQGIGFAVPMDLVRIMYDIVSRYGRYVRPALGVLVAPLNKAVARAYKLQSFKGLYVAEVLRGSIAEDLGVLPGDIIVEANGREVSNVFELRVAVADALVGGRPIELKVLRGGRIIRLE